MHRELLITAGPGEWRAALVENGAPVELRAERGDGAEFGSIHLARVVRRLPALGAALVDIGGDRPAFLPQSEVFPRGRRFNEGERIIVQIRREAQGGKAAALTTAITLRGRQIDLIAGRPGLAAGGSLAPDEQAKLIAAIAGEDTGSADKPGFGLRITASAPVAALVEQFLGLRGRWADLTRDTALLEPPTRLWPAATFAAALAAVFPTIARVLVDEPAAIPEIRAAFADAAVATVPEADWPFDLDGMFEAALSTTVPLAGHGCVHFEATQTAVLIDIDSGSPETGSPQRTALAIDLAAAEAIARQIRLRNLGGGIVIDFVGLDDRAMRERVRAALARALAADPLQPQILGWTRLGHLELVRRRRTRPLADAMLEPAGGGVLKTAATVAHEALHALRRAARAQPGCSWRLRTAAEVAAVFAVEAAPALRKLEQRFGRPVAITSDASLGRDRFQIEPL
ncbi:MAG TPA: ribonuclease E/G [Stellaceae bacterium]|nr:ribonuclease E/G [Stellaceae bacterium]